MELFYIVVSVIAIVVLILSLVFIGFMVKNGNQTQTFPPNSSQCPDLWIPDGSFCKFNGLNNGSIPFASGTNKLTPIVTDTHLNNDGSATKINPYDESIWGTSGLASSCAQQKWARTNGIEWSGISQLNTC